ncbi:MAG: macro domain-containing protein [Proteobacteria bacterium]|uniref:Macro domain-containing protein n=1 Tax=Candidatus Avisuccinivibrio stercorigallinarum TaxID=2840704 RepID=A0A9D9GT48_9GAMM|nr:macro domain-containing protein [Candidatus Avisuccinivibrio stercorigallinarum]
MSLYFTHGNIFASDAEALVNTVNCEGYMGKGLAYQFKLKYPENNKGYIQACRNGDLAIGKLYTCFEQGKLIINFPTKNKWRAKSKMSYIEDGLDDLIRIIETNNIKSIALPPLGSGNGGLEWESVKDLILNKLNNIALTTDIYIYEPVPNASIFERGLIPSKPPRLNLSAYVLMELKHRLSEVNFNYLRLQKAAFFLNIYLGSDYFKFKAYKFGPYDYAIEIICKNITEYQKYYGFSSTRDAQQHLHSTLISDKIQQKLNELSDPIIKACNLVNSLNDHDVECIATSCFLIKEHPGITTHDVVHKFQQWSPEKAAKFTSHDIENSIETLLFKGLISADIFGGLNIIKPTQNNESRFYDPMAAISYC